MRTSALVWVAAAVVAAVCVATVVDASLASAAAGTGRYFGVAIATYHLNQDATYAAIFDAEFNSVTPENEMKWDATEWNQNQFTFGNADVIVNHAKAHNMKVRGHTLVWHSQIPDWVKSLGSQQLSAAMDNHITNVAQHFKGQLYAWDVVNEAFADDQSGGLRSDSPFTKLGMGFIEQAFRKARSIDPAAKLCYNDYGTEGIWAKSTGIYNMVKDFKARGVPIDCVGFQTHLGTVPSTFQQNLQRFADLGVDVQITELDVNGGGQTQGNTYAAAVKACLGVSRCTGITVWGINDNYSWHAPDTPLMWDSNYNKKIAYYSTLNAFPSAPPPSSCSTPANPANGVFACAGTTCTAVCNNGYAATGTGYATCANNVWSSLPACVPTGGGASACNLASENNALPLSCATGQVINAVEFASFGTPKGDCANSALGTCHAVASLSVMQNACVGKASCSVNAATSVFGDPCSGTVKQLAVRARCAAATTVCATTNEWTAMTLACPAGQNIVGITFASFGTVSGTCGSFAKGTCHASSSLDVVQKACAGKNSCTFSTPMINTFGDPCSGTSKKLAVQALCA